MHTRLTPAILFLSAAAGLGGAFLILQKGFHLSDPPLWLAAESSPFLFLFAATLLFVRPRLGYSLALIAGLLAVPWFVKTENSSASFNSWVMQNYPSPDFSGAEAYLAYARLKILSVTLTVIAAVLALLRLLPSPPLNRRTWPAFAAGLLVLILWFGGSVMPYRIPVIARAAIPDFRILHVEKRGIRLHETSISAHRDGKTFISRYDRTLFRYRFDGVTAQAESSPVARLQVLALVESAKLENLHTPPPGRLRSWNAEGWYVVLKGAHRLAFTSENGTRPPEEVTQVFQLLETL